ncbi:hypothetical protein EPUS_01310 [Endocarpon pusillum Z07020]|uniref:Helix-turn-helix domain-containing protein n=1 Tax=Endocarpon pusillum (strain Z07020 / HMAS-L-300199) TaxID=1263415 RepID=U1I1X3_ENDPU|nr:uncharacterized protein EPUS_01310 [Endocarpon pusillum Z07020]ERF75944.1 hypothetical protein EPUS_01310 [Endocarpon pusillum Z07020]
MGSSSSKVAKTASSTARRYPATSSLAKSTSAPPIQPTSSEPLPGPTVHPRPSASTSRDRNVDLDARDPDYGSRLSQLGPVQPPRTLSNSSTFAPTPQVVKSSSSSSSTRSPFQGQQVFPSSSSNPELLIVQARDHFAKIFEEESESLGRQSFKGRTLVSAAELKAVLSMRDDGRKPPGEIEKQLRLRPGILGRLGRPGLVENA